MMTLVLCLIAILLLGWGYYRARPLGKLGQLAWFQSVALMSPWILLFGLMGFGIILNLAGILALLLVSIGIYIYLGQRLRSVAAAMGVKPKSSAAAADAAMLNTASESSSGGVQSAAELTENATGKANEIPFKPIPSEDLAAIKGIFSIDTFFAVESIPYQDGAIFKGNLRSDPETAHPQMTQNLEAVLGDRYRLFLVNDREGRPVVIILPSANDPKPASVFQRGFAVLLGLATVISCLGAAAFIQGFDLFSEPAQWPTALPIGLGLMAVLLGHEASHQVMARHHNVKFSWPFFFPTLQIGSFGALNRFESLVPDRRVLFDVAFAGPAIAGLLSFLMLIVGLLLSNADASVAETTVLLSFPTPLFQGSILVGTLSRVLLGAGIQSDFVAVHPLFVIGWLGLVITAINLMPAGQLDGGRMVQAVYGRKTAGITTFVTLIFLAIASLVNPLALYWAVIILFLQRDLERPTLNDLLEPDDTRAALLLFCLFVMVAVLIPLSPSLAGQMGIGR